MNKPHIYKITNQINGKYYYGVHNGTNHNYMGSGKLLKAAQEKHGIENFKKEILMWFDTEEEAYEYEAVVVNEKMIYPNNEMCYNLALGGAGGGNRFANVDKTKNGYTTYEKKVGIHSEDISAETRHEWSKLGHNALIEKYGPNYFQEWGYETGKKNKGKSNPATSETNRRINAIKYPCPNGCGYEGNKGNLAKHKCASWLKKQDYIKRKQSQLDELEV
jgi:hypothetical protein